MGTSQPAQDLDLERLAVLLEPADGLLPRPVFTGEGQVFLHDLAHPRFDLLELFGREGRGLGEVVVEAILDGGADGHAHLGEELLHRLRHHVRGRVAERGQGLGDAVELPGQLQMSIFFGLGHRFLRLRTKKHHRDAAR